jgi:hypothetical protein
MPSNTPPAAKGFLLGEKEVWMQLPRGMRLRASSQTKEAHYPNYIQWERKPWRLGRLMEERCANVIVVSFFDTAEYAKLAQNDGSMYASPYYLETIRDYHSDTTVYKTTQGRAPIIVRLDVKHEDGVFCLVASVETYENVDFEADVLEMVDSLKTFSPKREKKTSGLGKPAQ